MTEDKITLRRIEYLHPLLREEALSIYRECNQALQGKATIRFTQTLRTIAEQNRLYAKGRTAPGIKVTWAQGGYSYHNYGLAIDICLIDRNFKQVYWDTLQDYDNDGISDWLECARIFEQYGWEWGGRWRKPKTDMPHFQKTFGRDIKTLLALNHTGIYPTLA